MVNSYNMSDIMTEVHKIDFDRFSEAAEHRFSIKHRLAMKRIFRIYDRNTLTMRRAAFPETRGRLVLNRRTALIVLLIIILAAIAGCSVAYFISQSFRGEVHSDNTQLFAVNIENCPKTFDQIYYISEIPEGYELLETDIGNEIDGAFLYTSYINYSTGQVIVFRQWLKTEFSPHYNTEFSDIMRIEIGGCSGVYLDNGIKSFAWDNGDYILEITTDLSKKHLENLVISTKLLENNKFLITN